MITSGNGASRGCAPGVRAEARGKARVFRGGCVGASGRFTGHRRVLCGEAMLRAQAGRALTPRQSAANGRGNSS